MHVLMMSKTNQAEKIHYLAAKILAQAAGDPDSTKSLILLRCEGVAIGHTL